MKRVWLPCIFGIIYLVFFFGALTTYRIKSENEMAELKLSKSLNYCTDAAVEEMMDTADIKLDYAHWDDIAVDPQVAYDEFMNMFCFNYGYAPSEENRIHIATNFIPTFTVAAMDGYYIATPQMVKKTATPDYGMQFSPKLPYSYTDKKGTNITYGLNLNGESYTYVGAENTVKTKGLPACFKTKADVIERINKCLTVRIGQEINNLNKSQDNWQSVFYLPGAYTSHVKTNPVSGPSVIVLMQNVDWLYGRKVDAYSIGGGRLQRANEVACYERTVKGVNVNYYTYLSKLPKGVAIKEVFMSPKEAASHGYACDTINMK